MFNVSIYDWSMSICSCSLIKPKFINISYAYVKIEIFHSINYFDKSNFIIKLLKIETLVFYATQNSH